MAKAHAGLGRDVVIAVLSDLREESIAKIRALAPQARLLFRGQLDERPELLEAAEVVYTGATDARRFLSAPKLRLIQTQGAGVEWLLTKEIVARDELRVCNARGIHAQVIAEHVFGFILMFARNLQHATKAQLDGRWQQQALSQDLRTLAGVTLGILGLGAIGKRVAEIGAAFGMRVLAWRRRADAFAPVAHVYTGEQLDSFLSECDYLVNTLPHTAETQHLLDERAFRAMSRRPFVVNIGRGPTINHDALLAAVRSGQVSGAGLDVTEPEPLPPEHPLWREPNVLLTPHYAGAQPRYEDRALSIFLENIERYLTDTALLNLVDKSAGY